MATLIKTSGELVQVRPAEGRAFTLIELHQFVGGYIEVVSALGPDAFLVLNEDGQRLGLPVNIVASDLYHLAGGPRDDQIVGDVLLGTLEEIGGAGDDEEPEDDPEAEALIAAMTEELRTREAPIEIVLRPVAALQLAGLIQLALRHPGRSEAHAYAARMFIEHVRAFFADAPAVSEVLRRGDRAE